LLWRGACGCGCWRPGGAAHMTRTAAFKRQWPHHDQQKQHAATTPSMLCAGPLPLCSFCLEMVSMTVGEEQLQS